MLCDTCVNAGTASYKYPCNCCDMIEGSSRCKYKKVRTHADRIRAMSDEELAEFFFESTEIEFTVCEYCEYFGGHTSDTPCKHDMGCCLISAKNEAFKKWLKQPAEE